MRNRNVESTNRRRFLQVVWPGIAVAFAGCASSGDDTTDLEEKFHSLDSHLTDLQSRVDNLEDELSQMDRAPEKLLGEMGLVEEKIDSLRNELDSVRNNETELDNLESQVVDIESDLDTLERQIQELNTVDFRLIFDTHLHGGLGDAGGPRNVANYFGLARQLLEDAPGHGLMVGAGDDLHLSVESSVFEGQHMVDVLNASPLSYNPYGNHEFDMGPEFLREAVQNSEFQWVTANIIDTRIDEPFAAQEGTRRYAIEHFGDLRVAFTGLAPEETAYVTSVGDHVEVIDPKTAAVDIINHINDRAENVDLVILLSHLASPVAEELISEVDGFDIVVGDHAAVVEEEVRTINDTIFSVVGDELDYMGQLDLEIFNGKIVNYDFTFHDIVATVEAGEVDAHLEIQAIHESYDEQLAEQLDEVIGESTADLDVRRVIVRADESNFANYITDIIREGTNADIAVQNAGGIRSDQIYEAGDITRRDVQNVLPFPNNTAAVEMTGESITDAIEHGVSAVEDEDGRFLQVSGMSYTYDPNAPVGERVEEVWVNGEPIDAEELFVVGTNDFLFGGGDGYDIIADAPVVRPPEEGHLLSAAVTMAIQEAEMINPAVEGRINLLTGSSNLGSQAIVERFVKQVR